MSKKKTLELNGEIKTVSINEVKPYWRNPRNNDNGVEPVKKSISRHGYLVPIVVDKNMVIVSGHTRYRGLVNLGYTDIPVLVPKNMTDKQAKEFRIEDNSVGEFSTFDIVTLEQELREIDDIERINDQFSNLNVEELLADSVAITNFSEIETEEVNKKNEEMMNQFNGMGESANNGLALVTCPHCLEDFHVRKDEIKD